MYAVPTANTEALQPSAIQATLNNETWFGLTPNLANAAANARAQRVDRILIGRRLGSICEDPADELEKDGSSIEQGANPKCR
jgi:hypothetical protein